MNSHKVTKYNKLEPEQSHLFTLKRIECFQKHLQQAFHFHLLNIRRQSKLQRFQNYINDIVLPLIFSKLLF